MAFFFVETALERTARLYYHLPLDLHGVQVRLLLGAAGPAGESDHVVQAAVHR